MDVQQESDAGVRLNVIAYLYITSASGTHASHPSCRILHFKGNFTVAFQNHIETISPNSADELEITIGVKTCTYPTITIQQKDTRRIGHNGGPTGRALNATPRLHLTDNKLPVILPTCIPFRPYHHRATLPESAIPSPLFPTFNFALIDPSRPCVRWKVA